jgi:NADH dehydrogenase
VHQPRSPRRARQFEHADDTPREAVLSGRLAALHKEAIVRGTALFERHPTLPASA